MRTTLVIDDSLWDKVQAVAGPRKVSEFINNCLHEYFAERERAKRQAQLEKAYARVAKSAGAEPFDATDIEEWPAW